jgi:hypothetical protein
MLFRYDSCLKIRSDNDDYVVSEASLGEDVRSKPQGSLHVALDLELALHESSLRVQLAGEQINGIIVDETEGDVGFALLAVLDGAVAVLEIDGPVDWGLSFGGGDFHVDDCVDFLDCRGSVFFEEGLDFVKDGCDFKAHI